MSMEKEKQLWSLCHDLLNVLDETNQPAGYNIGYNLGKCAGGSIDHIHLHIIPRYPNEVGITDILAGKKLLVEKPQTTAKKIRDYIVQSPDSISST